ncbi:MAG TPA: ABC transporter substrate-binding protein [Gaiellaceae bacterium]|jgi:iron complex transport system substrate-binding protein
MGRVAAAAVAAALVLATTACGERSEPTGAAARLYPVTITTGDRPIAVAEPARRIAVVDGPSEELVRALGARVVGNAPTIATGFLRRLKPDLIVASDTVDERALSRAAAATHAEVYSAPGDSITQVERAITQLGLLTGKPVRARALVRRIERKRRAIDTALAHVPTVSVFVDTGLMTTVPDQSLIGDVLSEAHARNVAGGDAAAGPVDPAELARLDPDVYVVTADTMTTLADLRRNPATRKLRAVREGRFVVLDETLLAPGPRIGEGLDQAARLLHPDAFR